MIEPQDLILIAIVNRQRDLEMARLLGWYRIPLRCAPKLVHVDVIAFYQTAEFNDEKWSVRYAARIQGVELTRRIELLNDEPDHPRAGEEYYKMQLGPLFTLPRPILADHWKRITFLYTTGEKLLSAETISDLDVPTHERQILWGALRDCHLQAVSTEYPSVSGWEEAIDLFLSCADYKKSEKE